MATDSKSSAPSAIRNMRQRGGGNDHRKEWFHKNSSEKYFLHFISFHFSNKRAPPSIYVPMCLQSSGDFKAHFLFLKISSLKTCKSSRNLIAYVDIGKNSQILTLLGRTERKKCSPIDSGILGAYADIYRRLLVRKNPVGYFINFWPHRLSRSVHKAKNQWCLNSQKTKFYYESHIW